MTETTFVEIEYLLSVIYFFMLQELLEYFRMSLYKILTKRIR